MQVVETIDTFDELVEIARLRAPVYIRFSAGPGPDAEKASRDVEADVSLPGLPVASLSPEPWWTRPDEDWVARRLCKYLDLQQQAEPPEGQQEGDRRPWLLAGVLVGSGTDHEPLVGAVEAIGWVGHEAIEAAEAVYRSRFHGMGGPTPTGEGTSA